ncbi:PRC-barrel domain protein [Azorhizobium sp. AG788]|uniref:PRC-barrel domain-containing protein n=1 Tax=Azorhizobium sp. AG788 TaxID=2183897 RepID=UPI00105D861E|nr:PRC-barrel domain-containing protein [Azorhizobium sp. AG788]TDT91314.1 PRC-barrel domain protein [Azorhizobium sp. AG788]
MEPHDETKALISASTLKGTDVFDTEGNHVGSLQDVMIDKRTGVLASAVITFGGVLGIGGEDRPVPWNALRYDARQGGFVIGIPIPTAEETPAPVVSVAF